MKKYRVLGVLALAGACGGAADAPEAAVAPRSSALTVSTTDVVNQVMLAARQLQQASATLNSLVAGAYSTWPRREEFMRAQTVRGFRNDLEALNAVTFIAGAYASGAYVSPSLDFSDRMFVGGAYFNRPELAGGAYVNGIPAYGAYAFGSYSAGAYTAGAYAVGAYSHSIFEKVSRVMGE